MDQQALIRLAGERTQAHREAGAHCAEAVIRGVSEALGIPVDRRVLLAGLGMTGGSDTYTDRCGALAGGSVLIGIVFGRRWGDEDNTCPSDLTRRLHESFQKAQGTTACRLIERPEHGRYSEHCTPDVYRRTAERVAELILNAHRLCYTCEQFVPGAVAGHEG